MGKPFWPGLLRPRTAESYAWCSKKQKNWSPSIYQQIINTALKGSKSRKKEEERDDMVPHGKIKALKGN